MDPRFRALMAAELSASAEEGARRDPAGGGHSAPPEPVGQQQQRGSLILFEGADLLLEEDRGFISVLSDLIEDSKVREERGRGKAGASFILSPLPFPSDEAVAISTCAVQ